MPTHVRASVIVVTFNHREILPRCLNALRTTLGPDDEAIVVDNASTDSTAELVADAYPWVRLIRSDRNGGFGAACNSGVAAARGKVIAFLNPDTEPCAGWLDALLTGLETVPRAGLATAKLLLARAPHLVDTFGNDVHISGITTSRGWGEPAEAYTELEETSAISGACFAIPRELFQRLGGFDERLFLYYEDTDLSLRARQAGYCCIAVPDSRVLHDHTPGFSPAKLRYLERNRWWTLLKLLGLRAIVSLTPVLLMSEVLAWAMAVRRGPSHVVAKALAWADLTLWLSDLPGARAAAQMTRATSDSHLLAVHSTRLRFAQVSDSAVAHAGERLATLAFGAGRLLVSTLGAG